MVMRGVRYDIDSIVIDDDAQRRELMTANRLGGGQVNPKGRSCDLDLILKPTGPKISRDSDERHRRWNCNRHGQHGTNNLGLFGLAALGLRREVDQHNAVRRHAGRACHDCDQHRQTRWAVAAVHSLLYLSLM